VGARVTFAEDRLVAKVLLLREVVSQAGQLVGMPVTESWQ
jgi:hypothetical protein